MTAIHRYPPGITNVGSPCWCQSMFLAAHILCSEVDGTVHARGWCNRLWPVTQTNQTTEGPMPLPIEKTTIGPVRYRRRDTGQPIHAMRVQDVTLLAIRDWVPGAHTWAFEMREAGWKYDAEAGIWRTPDPKPKAAA